MTRLAATATLLVTDEQAARELLWRGQRSLIEENVAEAQSRLKSSRAAFGGSFDGDFVRLTLW